MNFSRQREIIYEQVRNFPVHPTAEEVYRALKNGLIISTIAYKKGNFRETPAPRASV